ADVLAQLAHFVDAAIRCSVDLDHVHARSLYGLETTCAHATWLCRGSIDAVQTTGNDARDGGLARTTLSGEDVAMSNAPLLDGILERGADVLLADQLRELCG